MVVFQAWTSKLTVYFGYGKVFGELQHCNAQQIFRVGQAFKRLGSHRQSPELGGCPCLRGLGRIKKSKKVGQEFVDRNERFVPLPRR